MAQTRVQAGGVLRTVKRVKGMADLRTFKRIRVMVSGSMVTVFQFFSATTSVPTVEGTDDVAGPVDITTPTVAAVVVGGTAPYTYLWTETGTPSVSWTINSPTTAVTSFTAAGVGPGYYELNTFICTVTDADTNVTTTNSVTATAINTNGS